MAKQFIKDFPITRDNQRNSEGSFCRLKDGRIAFAYSRFRSGHEDDNASDISVSFSDDNGESFSDGTTVLRCEEVNGSNLMSVSLLPDMDGGIMMFYLKKNGKFSCRMFMKRTVDFEHFSEEVPCICQEGYFVVNNDRVVRLSSGRIVIPAAFLPVKEDGTFGTQDSYIYASDDNGKSFYRLSKLEMPFDLFREHGRTCGLMEPGVLEYETGKIVFFSRTVSGRQFIAYSEDGCGTWTTPEPSRFESPCSPMSAKQLSDGRVLAVYNPIPEYFQRQVRFDGFWNGGRTPLLLSACKSNLNDEYKQLLLEDDERSGFCYTAIFEVEDKILLSYCAGNQQDGGILKRLRMISVPKTDLD